MRAVRYILLLAIIVCLLVILAVSLHSVDEIHYLKAFYPGRFTVEDAFYAALVEFIKVHIISLPLVLVILLCAYFLWLFKKD